MDGVSVAASIVGIATAGVQISIKLVTLATQISTASDRVSSIGNDISLTSGVLHQLGELMTQKITGDGISIFSQGGLETTKCSAATCERIFLELEREAKKASEQLRDCGQGRMAGGKIELSRAEKAKWPFLQPSVDTLRADLREAKGTLMLILQVTSLALSKRMADLNASASLSMSEQRDFVRAIIALRQQQQQDQRLELRGRNPDRISFSQQRATSTTGSLKPGTADRRRSLEQATPSLNEGTNFAIEVLTPQELTMNFPTLPGQGFSRDKNVDSALGGSIEAFKGPDLTRNDGNNRHRPDDLSSRQISSPSVSERHDDEFSARDNDAELGLFLLKPVVKDFFDRVEVSWSVQNTRMQSLAIRKYMADLEREGLPSVIEMLHELHAYEQEMVDTETFKYPEGSVLSLRRTRTDIQHRDMVFKAVPGLQFVVQHNIVQAPPILERAKIKASYMPPRRRASWTSNSLEPINPGGQPQRPKLLDSIKRIKSPFTWRSRRNAWKWPGSPPPSSSLNGLPIQEIDGKAILQDREDTPEDGNEGDDIDTPEGDYAEYSMEGDYGKSSIEGDHVEYNAVVIELLGKYTTLFG